ncbi:DUF445 domain-containing protein [Allofranklinella schreckenbergeri]|uniref:DUF445 domain-containing protein n=1 Tax=Allofranklinella schreckenbergeri TaxID=1076744 RepID=A0A3M6QT11_9BURK|nr:DUF445 domain-containing protein [Allofranklinella schreckenbergeri]RMW97615.1 DUF445 domain-containing protein [Allofranklinella schreckenbergeri]RMX06176.1 DUF445 domain-containing protein [Allofranklinella schreckenbergeri]
MRHPLALSLLLAATVLYIVATALHAQHPVWPYVAAFAEAAMVGALADWFAVVALFRHPLGLPIAHTAVLARNQQRLGQGLADFIDRNFLSASHVRERLAQFNAAPWLAQWLQQPHNVRALMQPLTAAVDFGVHAMDDARVRAFFIRNVRQALGKLDVSGSTAAVLNGLTAEGRHQALLDDILAQLARVVESESAQQHITQAIARELKALRYLALDQVTARAGTRQIVRALARNLKDMGESPDHPLRQRFDAAVQGWIERLQQDEQVQLKASTLRDQLLAHPALGAYLEQVWGDVLAWLARDVNDPASSLHQRLEAAITHLGRELEAQPAMQQWVNAQVQQIGPQIVERYRSAIHRYITDRVGQWDTRELIEEVEGHLGRDLQYIRINGTLVGGIVGLAIHTLTQWVMALAA